MHSHAHAAHSSAPLPGDVALRHDWTPEDGAQFERVRGVQALGVDVQL